MQVEKYGYKWSRKPSGYYQSTVEIDGKRRWLHQYTWTKENNKVQPKGYHIHHIDENKDNNCVLNLDLISASEHSILHGVDGWSSTPAGMKHIAKIRPMSAEWHGSEEGRAWHRDHREKIKDVILAKNKHRECSWCKKEVMSHLKERNVYCDKKCEFQYHQEHTRNKECVCVVCSKVFMWNKEKKTCSEECLTLQLKLSKKEKEYECKHCGKTYRQDREGTGYCSRSCKGKAERPKVYYEQRGCNECGTLYTPRRKGSCYCSHKCGRDFGHRQEKLREDGCV